MMSRIKAGFRMEKIITESTGMKAADILYERYTQNNISRIVTVDIESVQSIIEFDIK